MMNDFIYKDFPYGIFDYVSSDYIIANKVFQQGLKKEYLTFRKHLRVMVLSPHCGDST